MVDTTFWNNSGLLILEMMGRDWISRTYMPGTLQGVITVFVGQAFSHIKNCHLPSASTKIKSQAAAAADLKHTLKKVQGGDQE